MIVNLYSDLRKFVLKFQKWIERFEVWIRICPIISRSRSFSFLSVFNAYWIRVQEMCQRLVDSLFDFRQYWKMVVWLTCKLVFFLVFTINFDLGIFFLMDRHLFVWWFFDRWLFSRCFFGRRFFARIAEMYFADDVMENVSIEGITLEMGRDRGSKLWQKKIR